MFNKTLNAISIITLVFFFNITLTFAEIVKNIEIYGNERIPKETILMFSEVKINQNLEEENLNEILKNLYESNFFKDISVNLSKNTLSINVIENPIIEDVIFDGIKSKSLKTELSKNIKLKSRSSYNEFDLIDDKIKITSTLKEKGYYFARVETFIEDLDNNRINLRYEIDIGNKAKIKKISFIGNKIYKDRKLKGIILSEEFKVWKFISGKKYLNEELIRFDLRLLKNFYLNKGYYDVSINSSFAKLVDKDEFELIFNINAKEKFYFDNLKIVLPTDFNQKNFEELNDFFNNLKNTPYSINAVEKILNKINNITTLNEFRNVEASVEEKIVSNKINLNFIINESEKLVIQKINIFGNNITRESVIRNQLEVDEGDFYNSILKNKSINNLKSLNFFRSVSSEVLDGDETNSKIMNITVEEKPTGEIMAGAGFGTSGGTFTFGVKENNYLGKGIAVNANATVSKNSFKGIFGVTNPNFNNSDKSVFLNVQANEIDRLKNFGYKSNKQGFEIGTNFEYLDKLNIGLGTSSFYEKIETDDTASTRQKSQEGDYWDTFLTFSTDLDKRNQRFKTTDGSRTYYSLDLPIISDNNTLTNTLSYKSYFELYENNITSYGFFLQGANSITNDDIKLSERLYISGNRLRGFESGKIGPKDGDDFVGGNYAASFNISTTLPKILENNQNVDLLLFVDAANLWGVDYDSTINDSSKIRSSIGLAVDWLTVVGPLNFSLTETISKKDTDITESFRFNIGTTFWKNIYIFFV